MLRKRLTALLALTMIMASGITVRAQEIDVPQEVVLISEELGDQYSICPELIQAMCFKESSFRSDAENGGCVGIMQVAPKWHKDRMDRLGISDLFDTCQRRFKIVRNRRSNYVGFRRSHVTFSSVSLFK